MIYTKKQIDGDIEIKLNVYGDDFYCKCPVCGKEINLDESMLKHVVEDGCDFGGITFYCDECSSKEASKSS